MINEPNPNAAKRTVACEDWSALFPDAVEDLLGPLERQALNLHVAGCLACERELAEAQRGAAWLSLLREHPPEPPGDMVAGILARTSGALLPEIATQEVAYVQPVATGAAVSYPAALRATPSTPASLAQRVARWLGLGERSGPTLQPRLTMTAAMAFCSLCLTCNLLGISVSQIHAEDLRAASLQRSVEGKGERLLRSFTGIRVIYQVEARVNDWLTPGSAFDGSRSHHGMPQ